MLRSSISRSTSLRRLIALRTACCCVNSRQWRTVLGGCGGLVWCADVGCHPECADGCQQLHANHKVGAGMLRPTVHARTTLHAARVRRCALGGRAGGRGGGVTFALRPGGTAEGRATGARAYGGMAHLPASKYCDTIPAIPAIPPDGMATVPCGTACVLL